MRDIIKFEDYFSLLNESGAALRFLIRCAGYAPSSHNSQPWRFAIKDMMIEVRGDAMRALPASDPEHRQLFISVGCAIKNLCTAADLYGLRYRIQYFPDGNDAFLAARITFEGIVPLITSLPDEHLAFGILTRHNNRADFDSEKKVPDDFFATAKSVGGNVHVHFVHAPEELRAIATIVSDATEAAFEDKAFTNELSHWIKPSIQKYRLGMPGYNLGIPWPISFLMPPALRMVNMKKPQRSMAEKTLAATPTFMIITTEHDGPKDWVAAGETLEQLWLMAEQRGIRFGILAAAIQVGEFYKRIQVILRTSERPQVFCRIGFADAIPPASPRLSATDIIA